MDPHDPDRLALTRRQFFGRSAQGLGVLALASLLDPRLLRAGTPSQPAVGGADQPWLGVVHPLHFPPRSKRAIHLYMAGGPSHLESFDSKPVLARLHGQPMPESMVRGEQLAQLQGQDLRVRGPSFPFARHGASGQEIAEIFPHIGRIADDICIVRSMQTEQINHDPAHTLMNTGTSISGRPSLGAWLTYGLGSESDELPGFLVMTSTGSPAAQPISARQWHSGFLPSRFQGVQFHSQGDPVLYLRNPDGVSPGRQRDVIEAVKSLTAAGPRSAPGRDVPDPEVETRLSQYEMAFRMQTSVPELTDFAGEPRHVLDLYGVDPGKGLDGSFAANCLLARRLLERGTRFVQLYHRGWDHHSRIKESMPRMARMVDQASAALVLDLKQRGMLDDTLVLWGGEFGRTPMAQSSGRDHHIRGFSIWMAGGGIKGGLTHGATDELGYAAVDDVVHVHDLHATILRLFGVDHEKLTYRFQGRDFRLTDVHGRVVEKVLA